MGEIENPLTLSQLHHTLALCFNWSGNSAKGLTHSLKAFELGEKSGYILSMYGALFSRMLSYFFMEDYGKVSETFEKAKKMSEKNKITLIIEIFFSMAAFTELLQKNFHSLKTILDDFLPYPEKMGNKFAHVVFLYLRAALSFCKNQLTDAEKFLNEAMGIARNRELGITYPWLLSLYSEIYSNIGNRDELEKTTGESRDLRKRLPGLRFMFTHAQKITGKLKNFREEYISELQSQSSVSIFKEKLQLENIVKTSQMISSILDIDKLLDSILQSMLETTGAQRGVLKLDTYQKQETSFILKNISTEDTDFTFIKKTLETSGWQHGGSILAGKELREKGILSAIASPLIIKGKFIGVVYLDSKVINELFTEEEVKLLNIFTSQAAIAIENARTFEDLKQERNNLDLKVQERTQDLVKKNQIIEQRNRQFTDELKLAKAIQQSLIPARPPQFPGIRLASLYKPMEDVGGDFFDFIKVREPNLMGIFISDVSGHGVPAALITSMVKTLVETAGTNRVNPGDLLRYMNDSLTGQTGGNFMTAFYGVYDNKTGILNYARGGHNAPFLIRDDTILNLESRGKILGLMEDLEFEERQILLQAGDRILFYTDGLTEAANARGVEFEEIMPEILTNNESLPADDFLEVLYHSLLSHRGDFLFEDDVCVVVMDVV
jgi:serine phosphatase RsbU (regulator of sigma subunit)